MIIMDVTCTFKPSLTLSHSAFAVNEKLRPTGPRTAQLGPDRVRPGETDLAEKIELGKTQAHRLLRDPELACQIGDHRPDGLSALSGPQRAEDHIPFALKRPPHDRRRHEEFRGEGLGIALLPGSLWFGDDTRPARRVARDERSVPEHGVGKLFGHGPPPLDIAPERILTVQHKHTVIDLAFDAAALLPGEVPPPDGIA